MSFTSRISQLESGQPPRKASGTAYLVKSSAEAEAREAEMRASGELGPDDELEIVMDDSGQGTSNWLVMAPAFPEVTSFADDKREACVQGLHAIEEAIAGRIAVGMDVPAPMKTTPGKRYFVEVPALTFLKVTRRTGVPAGVAREQVERLFRLDHKSRLDQMEAAAFVALGLTAGRRPHSGDGEVA